MTVPKDVRDALGLRAGEPVEFAHNEAGEIVIRRPRRQPVDADLRRQRLAKLDAFAARFAHLPLESTDEYMKEYREPLPIPNPADL